MTTAKETCPKCGKGLFGTTASVTSYKCGTRDYADGKFIQSYRCRITELEREVQKQKTINNIQGDLITEQGKIITELENMLRKVLASAHPHPVEHAGMYAAWREVSTLLKGGKTE